MMLNFLWPSIATLVLILLEMFVMKRKNSPWYYVRFFCILLSLNLLFFMSTLDAKEKKLSTIIPKHEMWLLSNEQFSHYNHLYYMNVMQGDTCIYEARNLCYWIPNRTDRQKAEELFRIAVLTAVSLGDLKVIAGNLIISLSNYGLDVYAEYNKMRALLTEAKYHYKMAIFYLDILMRDGREINYKYGSDFINN